MASTTITSNFDNELYSKYRLFDRTRMRYASDDSLHKSDVTTRIGDKATFLKNSVCETTYMQWFREVVKKDASPLPASYGVTIELMRSLFANFKKNLKKTSEAFETIIISNKSFLDAFFKMRADPKILITTIPEIGTSFYHLLVEIKKLYSLLIVDKVEPTEEHLHTLNSLMDKIKLFFVTPMKKISEKLMPLFLEMT